MATLPPKGFFDGLRGVDALSGRLFPSCITRAAGALWSFSATRLWVPLDRVRDQWPLIGWIIDGLAGDLVGRLRPRPPRSGRGEGSVATGG